MENDQILHQPSKDRGFIISLIIIRQSDLYAAYLMVSLKPSLILLSCHVAATCCPLQQKKQ